MEQERSKESITLKVRVPRETLMDLGFSESDAALEMLKLFVINLYKANRITSGKAAEILGIRKYDFIRLLSREGGIYFDYTPLELEEEFSEIDRWEAHNG
jgi:predicted HTH domain antitoxin